MKFKKVTFEQFKKDYIQCFGELKNYESIIKESYDNIILPQRSTKYSAGYDFYLPYFSMLSKEDNSITIPTGICFDCTEEINNNSGEKYYLQIVPRSGLGFKYRVGLANSIAIIDMDYCMAENEGHILLKLVNNGDKNIEFPLKSKFAQGIICKFNTVDGDSSDDKPIRTGGFGSTDK